MARTLLLEAKNNNNKNNNNHNNNNNSSSNNNNNESSRLRIQKQVSTFPPFQSSIFSRARPRPLHDADAVQEGTGRNQIG